MPPRRYRTNRRGTGIGRFTRRVPPEIRLNHSAREHFYYYRRGGHIVPFARRMHAMTSNGTFLQHDNRLNPNEAHIWRSNIRQYALERLNRLLTRDRQRRALRNLRSRRSAQRIMENGFSLNQAGQPGILHGIGEYMGFNNTRRSGNTPEYRRGI